MIVIDSLELQTIKNYLTSLENADDRQRRKFWHDAVLTRFEDCYSEV
jgi:hypothetical protein